MTAPAGGAGPIAVGCAHCGAAIERSAAQSQQALYCCGGCEMAAAIIQGSGLGAYYESRESPAPRPQADSTAWDAVAIEHSDDRCAVTLAIDGLTCSACVWVTERVLLATPGVQAATVSHATGRARIDWDPSRIALPAIARRIAMLGYRPRPLSGEAKPDRGLLLRLGVAGFCSMNIMLLSASLYAGWFDGIDPRFVGLFQWTSLALATPIALWCAEPLYVGAWAGLRHRVLHMDLPVSIGVIAMYAQGVYATIAGRDTWLDSLSMLVTLLIAGRLWEQRGRRSAVEAATALASTAPRIARRAGVDVAASALIVGDILDVGLGEEIAADGIIVRLSGARARVRMSLLTGEAEPVEVRVGDAVVAGSLVEDGAIVVRVEATGGDTLLARMAAELARAADRPTPPSLTDRIAPWFTGLTLILAALALAIGGPERAMAVLVVACPCALALAGPLSTAAGLGASARRGLLVRSGEALRSLATITTVAFDKTGTITHGEPAVTAITAGSGTTESAVLRIAAGLERASGHPIARAIRAEAARRGVAMPEALDLVERPGSGISGVIDGVRWTLRAGAAGEVELCCDADPAQDKGGRIGLRDVIRDDAARTVAALKAAGYRVVLVSGDHPEVVQRIAVEAGITEVLAGATPEAKAAWVRAQDGGVLFVGDGVNDGPALAAATVGVAMGTGVASTVTVADAVVARDGLGPVAAGLRAARAAKRAIRGNASRSLVYNALAVTAAVAGWVNPLIAAVLMPLSSAMVAWGAARVEKWTR